MELEENGIVASDGEVASYWLVKAPVWRAIAHMAVPMVLGMAAMAVYNFTDMFFLGMLDDTAALAAVILCSPVMSLMIAVATFLEVGGDLFWPGRWGRATARRREAPRPSAARLLWDWGSSSRSWCRCASILFSPCWAPRGAAAEPTRQFLLVFCLGAPFVILNMVGCQIVCSVAKSKEASAGTVASAVINIVLDPVLIFGLGLGVRGAALATVVSNAAAACYFLVLIAKSDMLSCNPRWARLPWAVVSDIAKTGCSGMILGLLMGAASLVFNNVAMAYGAAVLAAFGIAQSVVQLLEVVAMGLCEGVVPLMAEVVSFAAAVILLAPSFARCRRSTAGYRCTDPSCTGL